MNLSSPSQILTAALLLTALFDTASMSGKGA